MFAEAADLIADHRLCGRDVVIVSASGEEIVAPISRAIADLSMLGEVGHPSVANPDRALRKEAGLRDWPVLSFSRPVPLRERIPAPSGAAMATSAALVISALAGGALAYSLTSAALHRFSF